MSSQPIVTSNFHGRLYSPRWCSGCCSLQSTWPTLAWPWRWHLGRWSTARETSNAIVASILWQIWKVRNHFIFRQQRTDPDQLVDAALADAMLYRNSLQQPAISDSALLNPTRLWTPPDQGSFKANIDGAFTSDTHLGAIACVLRDSTGILIGGCSCSCVLSPAMRSSSPNFHSYLFARTR